MACKNKSTQILNVYKELNYVLNTFLNQFKTNIDTLKTGVDECCTATNNNYQNIIDLLDLYIANMLDCCDMILGRLDIIISQLCEYPCFSDYILPTTTSTTVDTSTTTVDTSTTTVETGTTTSEPSPDECNVPTTVSMRSSVYPYTVSKFLGSDTGLVTLTYDAYDIPDRFVVRFDENNDGVSETVIDTGYVGEAIYQVYLDDAIVSHGDTPSTINPLPVGVATFCKTSANEWAYVDVYAPLRSTGFTFTLSCPEPPCTTTTTTTVAPTTTTTTAPVTTTTTTEQVCNNYTLINVTGGETTWFLVTYCEGDTVVIGVEYLHPQVVCAVEATVIIVGEGLVIKGGTCTATTTTTTVAPTTTTTTSPVTTTTTTEGVTTTTTTGEPTTTTTTEEIPTTTTTTCGDCTTTTTTEGTTTTTTTGEPTTTTTTEEITTTTTTEEVTTTTTTTVVPTTTTTTQEPCDEGYGLLYNFYAIQIIDNNTIAPDGWHVPSKLEYEALSTNLGGDAVAGGYMKETGTIFWETPNTGADNTSGFTARGGGARSVAGIFTGIKEDGNFYTSDNWGGTWARRRSLNYTNTVLNDYTGDWNEGYSIRLIKNDDDDSGGIMYDNNGYEYPIIKIGSQVWMAQNLRTTKYRNTVTGVLSDIPEVTDGDDWAALTTGAYCKYNNDNTYECSQPTTTTTTVAPTTTTTTTAEVTTTTTTVEAPTTTTTTVEITTTTTTSA